MTEENFKTRMFEKLIERKIYKEDEKALFEKEYVSLKDEFALFLEIVNEEVEKMREHEKVILKQAKHLGKLKKSKSK